MSQLQPLATAIAAVLANASRAGPAIARALPPAGEGGVAPAEAAGPRSAHVPHPHGPSAEGAVQLAVAAVLLNAPWHAAALQAACVGAAAAEGPRLQPGVPTGPPPTAQQQLQARWQAPATWESGAAAAQECAACQRGEVGPEQEGGEAGHAAPASGAVLTCAGQEEQGEPAERAPSLEPGGGSDQAMSVRARKRRRADSPEPQPQSQPSPQQQEAVPEPSAPSLLCTLSLSTNEVACTLRLVSKATAAQFCWPQYAVIRLSQPVPHREFAWRWGAHGALRKLALRERRALPCLTARSGSIANLEVLRAQGDLPHLLDAAVFKSAAAAGHLHVCIWLHQHGCPCDLHVLPAAARGGHAELCEWLLAHSAADRQRAAAGAAVGGHVGLVERLLGGDSPDAQVLEGAAAGCDLPTLQRLYGAYLRGRGVGALPMYRLRPSVARPIASAAAASPTPDWRAKVEWLEARGFPRTADACVSAAKRPDAPSRLAWLRGRGYPLGEGTALRAAGAGNLEALQFAAEQGVVADGRAMDLEAQGGHVGVMQWLHARGLAVGEGAVGAAAEGGHPRAVAWLVVTLAAADRLTASVFAVAARAGSVWLLAWLRWRGCPWDETAFAEAAEWGSEEQLEWLAEQGCPKADDGMPYARAAAVGEVAILRCLLRLGYPWSSDGSTFRAAVTCACLANSGVPEHVGRALCWLLDLGCVVEWDDVEPAAGECVEMVRWLQEQRRQRTKVED
ncbi:hypothetical protein TSOC_013184 [Tetrabaena socialis]|uniref:Ankyrin repeat domain-containing protein n=1 Tax=Tetrabaena socialis TaxID=47790 RepID=A0A2J7ZL08_9CHLO|nr:hypothetical protein TSOC_013184 [Tetrabaena socialis]|eukprot:PNH00955.1 hypothetical protein TSOC_013184 [Tetrabaena socialis]